MKPLAQLPHPDEFETHLSNSDLEAIRSLFLETHSIALQLMQERAHLGPPPKKHTDFKHDPTIAPHDAPPSFVITYGGQYWRWNCGWQQYNPATNKYFGPILGHRAFRRKPVCHQKDRQWINKPRPFGPWRRVVQSRMNHFHHGNVDILETDGIIAVIRTDEGILDTVSYHGLTEISTPLIPKLNKEPKTKRLAVSDKPKGLSRKSLLDLL